MILAMIKEIKDNKRLNPLLLSRLRTCVNSNNAVADNEQNKIIFMRMTPNSLHVRLNLFIATSKARLAALPAESAAVETNNETTQSPAA
jgi:hypothetical protein